MAEARACLARSGQSIHSAALQFVLHDDGSVGGGSFCRAVSWEYARNISRMNNPTYSEAKAHLMHDDSSWSPACRYRKFKKSRSNQVTPLASISTSTMCLSFHHEMRVHTHAFPFFGKRAKSTKITLTNELALPHTSQGHRAQKTEPVPVLELEGKSSLA